jgi:hypothetical protein
LMCARRRRDRVSDRAGLDRAFGKTRGWDESVVPLLLPRVGRARGRAIENLESLEPRWRAGKTRRNARAFRHRRNARV